MPVSAEAKTDSSDKRLSFAATTEELQVHTPHLAVTKLCIRLTKAEWREVIQDLLAPFCQKSEKPLSHVPSNQFPGAGGNPLSPLPSRRRSPRPVAMPPKVKPTNDKRASSAFEAGLKSTIHG